MGERKVLNKYIPADFDPSLVPRGKKLSQKDGTVPVRMMLPFTIQCASCNTFLYRGRKFNSKKENMDGPRGRYLGIQRYRFYFKCNHCSRTLTILTDPEHTDYEMESGGTRNYDVHKDKKTTEDEFAAEKEQEEKDDPMRALENRVLDSQREMADWDNLEEIQAMNKKHIQLLNNEQIFAVLDARKRTNTNLDTAIEVDELELNEHGLTEEEEAMVQAAKFGINNKNNNNNKKSSEPLRLSESDEEREETRRKKAAEEFKQRLLEQQAKQNKSSLPSVKIKRKKIKKEACDGKGVPHANKKQKTKPQDPQTESKETTTSKPSSTEPENTLGSLLASYGSDSD
ncbi:protein of unknown function DUF572 containing protein [Nitzschia inconspicua]|uniref:Splicing factor YJU2 n=1 Tax=Nitzschia inconspicua TaxID=303405 RepID=A0A9K3PG95_9STRA|nr:protein of unknown function DUF572 containing protein [Nitzschia inconspicua]